MTTEDDMPYLIIIAPIVGVLWLAAQAVAFLVGMAAIPAAMLAAPSVAAMRAINASLGFHPYDIDLYVILHALLGGALGLSGHMMVRHLRPGERMVRALGFMQRALHGRAGRR